MLTKPPGWELKGVESAYASDCDTDQVLAEAEAALSGNASSSSADEGTGVQTSKKTGTHIFAKADARLRMYGSTSSECGSNVPTQLNIGWFRANWETNVSVAKHGVNGMNVKVDHFKNYSNLDEHRVAVLPPSGSEEEEDCYLFHV